MYASLQERVTHSLFFKKLQKAYDAQWFLVDFPCQHNEAMCCGDRAGCKAINIS